MTDGEDNFEFSPMVTHFPGYNSAFDKTMLARGFLIRGSQNVYKKISGTIATRFGLLRRGAADATLAGVDSAYDWNTWDGRCLPVRICNGNLQVESDIVTSGTYVWYTLLSSLTKTRWVFDAWWDNTAKKDVLLMVDGTSTLRNWSGGAALFVSYAGAIITLDRNATTAGFTTAGGSVIINGTPYTYGGVSGSTLTGTSDASAVSANAAVFDVPGSTATTPASSLLNDWIKVDDNHVYVGSYTSRLVYVSKTTSYTDYTQSTPRIPGDGELLTLDANSKGMGVRNGNPWIAAGTSFWYEITFSQITVGTTLSEQTKVEKKPVSVLSTPLGHEFIDSVGGNLVALCQDHQLRLIGTFTNQFETKYPSLSLAVQDELSDETFTGGHVKAIGGIVYITAPLSGRDYMLETREGIDNIGQITQERFWHPPQVRNVSRFSVINGVVFGHSNSNPQIYQVWDTAQWHDDSPSDESLPYDVIARFAYEQFKTKRQGMTSFDKAYFEGYCTEGTNLYAKFRQDYQGATSIQTGNINVSNSAKFFNGTVSPSLGDSSLGDNPLGQGLSEEANDQETLPKFRKIVDNNPVDVHEYSVEVFSTDLDCRWELLAYGTNATEGNNYPVQLRG